MVKQTMGKLTRSIISENLIGMGDSHLDNFTFFCAATCRVPGATAYGLLNNNSETMAREAFKGFLDAFPKHIPLLCLGEVDCNSLPWKFGRTESPESFIYQSIEHLFTFLDEFNRQFILPSVTLPPIDAYKGLGIRHWVTSNMKDRTILVKLYNALLATKASEYGHRYLDITSQTVGPDGLIDKSFIISHNDVHLDPSKMYSIVRKKLDEVANV
jgi:hypothetical protein